MPLIVNKELIGIVKLGNKRSDEEYTQDDLDILLPLSKTLAIAISNAKLFEELGKAQAEAAQREKMATIGTLAAGMAHEIRNPITTIRTFADFLPERFRDKEFMDTFYRLIPGEVERVESIARSLLEFSYADGADEVSVESFKFSDMVKNVLLLLEAGHKLTDINTSVQYIYDGDVSMNKIQAQESLFGVLKYIAAETPKQSCIVIEVRKLQRDLVVDVKDGELNIPVAVIKDILEPASKLQKTKRGFGFDLFVAKQLIEKSGGTFFVHSDAQSGAEFKITFKNAVL